MSKYPSGISYDEFYAALDAYCDAMIRAALDAAGETCDVATMDGVGDIIRGKGDEIRALANNPEALAAIKARAGGHT